jgi:hypothetical protein
MMDIEERVKTKELAIKILKDENKAIKKREKTKERTMREIEEKNKERE